VGEPVGSEPVGSADEDEEYEEPQPAQLPHHTFGSVWDSQIGVPSAAMPVVDTISGGEAADEEDFDEPEVPEYLLAERRQHGQRPGRGGRAPRGRSAYQAALDRERFGRGAPQPVGRGAPQPAFGGSRAPERGRDRGRGGRPAPGGRPGRPPRMDERPQMSEPRTSSEPWSEVPPELEQLLRAELSRKQPAPPMSEPAPTAAVGEPVSAAEPEIAAKPVRRRRATGTEPTALPIEVAAEADAAAAPAKPAPAKATRSRAPKASVTAAKPRARKTAAAAESGEAAPKKPATRRRSASAAKEEG